MIKAFLFYQRRTRINRLSLAIRRLKEPKYLLGVLAFLAYLGFMAFALFAGLGEDLKELPGAEELTSNTQGAGAWFLSLLLLSLLLPAIRGAGREPGLAFKKPELMFLLAGPISRRQILGFWLGSLQPGLALTGLVMGLLSWRGTGPLWAKVLIAYLGANAVLLLPTALKLLTCAMRARGLPDWVQRAPFRLVALVFFAAFVRAHEPLGDRAPLEYMAAFTAHEPLHTLMAPLVGLASGFLAETGADALPALLGILACDGILLALVFAKPARFEEASLQISDRIETFKTKGWSALRRQTKKQNKSSAPGVQHPPPFELRAQGPRFLALVWKNVIGTGRLHRARLFLPAFVVALLFGTAVGQWLPEGPGPALASTLALYGTLIGVLIIVQQTRHDLRRDLGHLVVLKSYPLSARDLIQGEVLGLALVAMAYVAMGCALAAGVCVGVGGPGGEDWTPIGWSVRAPALVSAIAAGAGGVYWLVTSQNLIALLWPAWVQTGSSQVVNVARFGGQLVGMLVTSLLAGLASIPAMLAAGLIYAAFAVVFVSDAPSPVALAWCSIPAAVVFGGVLVVEAQLLLTFAEGELRALDVSRETLPGEA